MASRLRINKGAKSNEKSDIQEEEDAEREYGDRSLEDAFEQKLSHTNEATAKALDQNIKNDAVMALTALGYSSSESLKAVSKVEIKEDMDVEDILRAALKHMALF